MAFQFHIVLIFVMIISYQHESIATTLVAPITKHTDSTNPLYTTQIMTKYVNFQYIHTNFLIDIEAPFTWYDCIVQWNTDPGPDGGCPSDTICLAPVSCEEYQCTDVRTSTFDQHSSCPQVTNTSTLPGWGTCSCPVSVVNPIDGSCVEPLLNYDELRFHSTDGRSVVLDANGVYPNSACAPSSAFELFPKHVNGVLALSMSSHSLLAYLFYSYERSFALCLPRMVSSNGVLFIGRGPYYLHLNSHSHADVDVRSLLSYTTLMKHKDSFGYFIAVSSIVIKNRSIDIPANATTKISTIVPYTTLITGIYKQVVRRFSKVTKRLHPAKAVAPFGLCFNGTDLKVPDVVFGLSDGGKWTVSTANLMKHVRKDVACLAFVDGGGTSEHAMVIGTFQMEDNFLLFDLVNSSLGFSSSLLSKGTSCSSFNFTGI